MKVDELIKRLERLNIDHQEVNVMIRIKDAKGSSVTLPVHDITTVTGLVVLEARPVASLG